MGKTDELVEQLTIVINKDLLKEDGYKLSNTHFKVSQNQHSVTYYYLKRFFENGKNAEDVASLMYEEIAKEFKENTTFISYGSYSNFYLNKLCVKLNQDKKYEVNYIIANDRVEEKLTFQFDTKPHENIIVVVPGINTSNRLRKFISKIDTLIQEDWKNKNLKINKTCYAVFSFLKEKNGIGLGENKNDSFTIKPFIFLESDWHPEQDCRYCFYSKQDEEIANQDPTKERYIFPVNEVTETPLLIFDHPKFNGQAVSGNIENQGPDAELKFNDVFKIEKNGISPHLWGHLIVNEKFHFIHYIKTSVFYENNKTNIRYYLKSKLIEFICQRESKKNVVIKELIFIIPHEEKSSCFVEDLVGEKELTKYKASIVCYQPFNEFAENFNKFYHNNAQANDEEPIERNQKLFIYYSDVIFNGDYFKELNTFFKVKSKSNNEGKTEEDGIDDRFDLVLTLIDRSTEISKIRIVRRLAKDENGFISFFKLNVPLLRGKLMGNPILERKKKLQKVLNECHLDALKSIMIREIKNCTEKKIEELEDSLNKPFDLVPFFNFKKFQEDKEIEEFYKYRFTKRHLGLLKLNIFHELSSNIHKLCNHLKALKSSSRFNEEKVKVVEDFITELAFQISADFFNPEQTSNLNGRQPGNEIQIVKDNIIKKLARLPFILYEPIRDVMFIYCIDCLDKVVDDIKTEKKLINYLQFRNLKFFIRRTVELNSNYIISHKFISLLKDWIFLKKEFIQEPADKNLYTDEFKNTFQSIEEQKNNFKYYLAYCYKELLIAEPAKAIELESLLNSPDLVPDVMLQPERYSLKEIMEDEYYAFCRVLKIENIGLISKYKEQFLLPRNTRYKEFEGAHFLVNIYSKFASQSIKQIDPTNKFSDSVFNFLEKSFYKKSIKEYNGIVNAFKRMLSVALLVNNLSERENTQNDHGLSIEWKIRQIFNSIVKLFSSTSLSMKENTDYSDNLSWLFFIEYENSNGLRKIYTICSKPDTNDYDLDPDHYGLISKMFDGLFHLEKGNLQTLIPIIKDNETKKVFSYLNKFYERKTLRDTENETFNEMTSEEFQNAFELDEKKFVQIREANMLHYFRLSEISYPEKSNRHIGKAVFVICNTKNGHNNDKKDFLDFFSVEKLRLLLLLKEEIIDYLKKLTDNDSFNEMLDYKSTIDFNHALNHGVKANLMSVFGVIPKENKDVFGIIQDLIIGQFVSLSHIELPLDQVKITNTNEIKKLLREKVQIICESTFFGQEVKKIDLNINIEGIDRYKIEKIMLDVVFPEILINMNKKLPTDWEIIKRLKVDKISLIKVNIEDDKLVFVNPIDPNNGNQIYNIQQVPKNHGLYMCLKILKKLNYDLFENYPINIEVKNNKFQLEIKLRS